MNWIEIAVLIAAGVMVGFINTLAGGGSIISLSLLMFMGLPAQLANGTNRVAVLLQTFTATLSFKKSGLLKSKKGWYLAIPGVLGSLVGSFISVEINEQIFEQAIVYIMFIMLIFIFYKPSIWLKGKEELLKKKAGWFQYLIFFLIGIYGGFIHAGIGYLLLIALVLGAGFNLIEANALKVLTVFLYIPFTLIVFIYYGQVDWFYGLILSIGNIAGAYIASHFATTKGAEFVRWVILIVVIFTALHVFGVIDIKSFYASLLR